VIIALIARRRNNGEQHTHMLDRFTFIEAATFAAHLDYVPDCPGVYVLLMRDGDRLLGATDYFEVDGRPVPVGPGGLHHMYTGQSHGLRTRLKRHVLGDARVSTFRTTLLAIDARYDALSVVHRATEDRYQDEVRLTRWLTENLLVGLMRCDACCDTEAQLLRALPSPLNITLRKTSPFARSLIETRRAFRREFSRAAA
jgi:hypothetical protein